MFQYVDSRRVAPIVDELSIWRGRYVAEADNGGGLQVSSVSVLRREAISRRDECVLYRWPRAPATSIQSMCDIPRMSHLHWREISTKTRHRHESNHSNCSALHCSMELIAESLSAPRGIPSLPVWTAMASTTACPPRRCARHDGPLSAARPHNSRMQRVKYAQGTN